MEQAIGIVVAMCNAFCYGSTSIHMNDYYKKSDFICFHTHIDCGIFSTFLASQFWLLRNTKKLEKAERAERMKIEEKAEKTKKLENTERLKSFSG